MNFARTALLLAAMTGLFLAIGYLLAGEGGLLIAFLVALAMNGWAYWNSDQMVLRMHDARPVSPESAPELYGLVEQLARRAGLPMPKVYLIETSQPNAFATGRDPEHAAVAVTRGLLQACDSEELAGVLAHELGHIKHRDTLTMTITATLAGAIGFLSQFAFFFGMGRGPAQQPARDRRHAAGDDPRPARRHAGPDGDLALARVRGRPGRRRVLRPPALARPGARQDRAAGGRHGQRDRRAPPGVAPICSSSIPCTWAGSTTCSAPIPRPRTASAACRRWPASRPHRVRAAAPGAEHRPRPGPGGDPAGDRRTRSTLASPPCAPKRRAWANLLASARCCLSARRW